MRIFLAGTGSNADVVDCDCKYRLESFFEGEKPCAEALKRSGNENFLLDSGAFSFMSGQKCSKDDLVVYLDNYADFINKYDVKYFFELDVDTIFGIEYVEELRRRLERKTNKKCIPVWHKGRGIEYWKKMVEQYDYVAIGGLVFHVKKSEWPLIKKMVDYAYRKGVKVHGLGFTKTRILEKEKWHFYSVDSISYISTASRGGNYAFFNGRYIETKKLQGNGFKKNLSKLKRFNCTEWCKYQKYMDKEGNI